MFLAKPARACLLACLIPVAGWTPASADSNPIGSQSNSPLSALVDQLLANSPDIQAAKAMISAAQSRLEGSGLAINNPELDVEAERSDINIFKLGVSQTIDWYDQRGASEQAAEAELAAARAELASRQLTLSAELLQTIGKVAAYREITALSQRRSDILQRFSELAQQRFNSGDIPPAELELARLSLTEAIMQQAGDGAELIQARSDFLSLYGAPLEQTLAIPKNLPTRLNVSSDTETLARNHPQVQLAHQQAIALAKQVDVVDRERKANPSFGINAGREASTNTIGVSFSIPLQINNKFKSTVDVARAQTLQAQQLAQQAFRSQLGRIQGAQQRYQLIANAWKIWISQGRSSLQQRSQLLESQWQSGEMSTTDYLIQIQQTLDTQIAGAELQSELWSAWIDWLSSTNQLSDWLNAGAPKS